MIKSKVLGLSLLSFSFFAAASHKSEIEMATLRSAHTPQIVLVPKQPVIIQPAGQPTPPLLVIPRKEKGYTDHLKDGFDYCLESLKAHPFIAAAVVALCASGYAYKKGYFDALLAKLGIKNESEENETMNPHVMQN